MVPGPGALGVLGGTFDPVHLGHLAIARHARDALALERVLLVPAGAPPHKRDRSITSATHRLAMVELAIVDDPSLEASRIEIDRPGPSYSVDTMALLAAEEPDRELFLILSSEAAAALPGWHEPDRLLDLCRLAVMPRDGRPAPDPTWIEAHFPGRADRFVALDGPDIPIAASRIRRLVAEGGSIDGLVPAAVASYIRDHRLYTRDVRRTS
jgi:nicotinate-nucleotide adenylyltransferase